MPKVRQIVAVHNRSRIGKLVQADTCGTVVVA